MRSAASQIHSIVSRLDSFTAYFGRIAPAPLPGRSRRRRHPIHLQQRRRHLRLEIRPSGRQGRNPRRPVPVHHDRPRPSRRLHRRRRPHLHPPDPISPSTASRSASPRHLALQHEWKRQAASHLPHPQRAHPLPLRPIARQRRRRHRLAPARHQRGPGHLARRLRQALRSHGRRQQRHPPLQRHRLDAGHPPRPRGALLPPEGRTGWQAPRLHRRWRPRSPRPMRPMANSSRARSPASAPTIPSSSRSTSAARSMPRPACSTPPAWPSCNAIRRRCRLRAIANLRPRSSCEIGRRRPMGEGEGRRLGRGNPAPGHCLRLPHRRRRHGRNPSSTIDRTSATPRPRLHHPLHRRDRPLLPPSSAGSHLSRRPPPGLDRPQPPHGLRQAQGPGRDVAAAAHRHRCHRRRRGPVGHARQGLPDPRHPGQVHAAGQERDRLALPLHHRDRPLPRLLSGSLSFAAPSNRRIGRGWPKAGWQVIPTPSASNTPCAARRSCPAPPRPCAGASPTERAAPTASSCTTTYIMADALVAKLDQLEWHFRSETMIVPAKDPLEEMSHFHM